MQMLPRTLPRDLDDLTVQVALVRPGPIQGGAIHPYIERRKLLREDPGYEVPYEHPLLRAGAGGDARHDRLPGAGDRGGDGALGLLLLGGRGAAPGDEPQALRGGAARYHDRFVAGAAERGVPVAHGGAGLGPDRGLLRLRLPEGALGRLRPARLPVGLAAGPLRPGVPLLAAQRAADGLLPARRAGPRGAAPRGAGGGPGRQPQPRPLPRRARVRGGLVVRVGLGYVKGVREEEMEEPGLRARARRPVPGHRRPRLALGRRPRRAGAAGLGRRAGRDPAGPAREWGGAPRGALAGRGRAGRAGRGEGTQLALPLEPPAAAAAGAAGGLGGRRSPTTARPG